MDINSFSPATAEWFTRTFGKPTAVQEAAWPVIASGRHVLVSAPTGAGKTLAAFLVFIDRMIKDAQNGGLKNELYVLYLSPLKSLAADIRENLNRPLDGLAAASDTPAGIRAAVRTGDTGQAERRAMNKRPPHILITTPESFYIMLTSHSGKAMLKTARAVIVDELHSVINSKRGAHLTLSLARLDVMCAEPPQRIGLSATITPLNTAAAWLSPDSAVIIAPKMKKESRIEIISPLKDENDQPEGSIWPDIGRAALEHCEGARSALAFTEGRIQAEKLAYHVNQLAGEGFAAVHHGSVSKERRAEAENALRAGKLRLLCATSSMELGIDVGEIDLVLQVGFPNTISALLQRLGRSGHNPGRTSVMRIFPRTALEGIYCAMMAELALRGQMERCRPPRECWDVLAQHLVSMAVTETFSVDEVLKITARAYPFKGVAAETVYSLLKMLSGDYEHGKDIPARPRLLYESGRVKGDNYSRMLALNAGGSIPDRGLFAAKTETGVRLGELDEEFVFEARVGDRFLLGAFAWKILHISKDTVIVAPASVNGVSPPFWKGDGFGRTLETGTAFGALLRGFQTSWENGLLPEALRSLRMDKLSAKGAAELLDKQLKLMGCLPSDKLIILEYFSDETGARQLMVHSVFGRPVNEPMALLVREIARSLAGADVCAYSDDDGFLLFGLGNRKLPDSTLSNISPRTAETLLRRILPATALFNMAFRYNAGRALMIGARGKGRQPLWVQRFKGAKLLELSASYADHPLIAETIRECMEDYWSLDGLNMVLSGIREGRIGVVERETEMPSPMSLNLRRAVEANQMYNYSPTPSNVTDSAYKAAKALGRELIKPDAIELSHVSGRVRKPENENRLHALLTAEGDFTADELGAPVEWLERLAKAGRILYIDPGLWIAAEQRAEYESEDLTGIARRCLRYRGGHTISALAGRYFIDETRAANILETLTERREAVLCDGLYYHADMFERARRRTITNLRGQARTQPPERYAALMAGRLNRQGSPAEQLAGAMEDLRGQDFPAALWEGALLPARVNGYRPGLLDDLLASGEFYWHITDSRNVAFERYDESDWDTEGRQPENLTADETVVYEALSKRGASFWQSLSGVLNGRSPYDALIGLAEKGYVHADSFVSVRQMQAPELGDVKQRARIRAIVQTSGRWALVPRPRAPEPEKAMERAFKRSLVVCRETVAGMTWSAALEPLRVMEYTGRARRGYFVEGMSGAQFIKAENFAQITAALEHPPEEIVWLCAADPNQVWGKALAHLPERAFTNIAGTFIAMRTGVPVMALERKGRIMRSFNPEYMCAALEAFVKNYENRRVLPLLNRVTVKTYPPDSGEFLEKAGFTKSISDYVLYRKY
ncbi:MAG: DEAD/DEAH box helicase [Clostridiales bacterium]|jgi:ATP-dependent Lhr-like helicase|nr:DEAD/DEAH box helicase [Clostridiales bacterium]